MSTGARAEPAAAPLASANRCWREWLPTPNKSQDTHLVEAQLPVGAHGAGALVQHGVLRPVVQQPRHRQALLLATAQRLLPVLHLRPWQRTTRSAHAHAHTQASHPVSASRAALKASAGVAGPRARRKVPAQRGRSRTLLTWSKPSLRPARYSSSASLDTPPSTHDPSLPLRHSSPGRSPACDRPGTRAPPPAGTRAAARPARRPPSPAARGRTPRRTGSCAPPHTHTHTHIAPCKRRASRLHSCAATPCAPKLRARFVRTAKPSRERRLGTPSGRSTPLPGRAPLFDGGGRPHGAGREGVEQLVTQRPAHLQEYPAIQQPRTRVRSCSAPVRCSRLSLCLARRVSRLPWAGREQRARAVLASPSACCAPGRASGRGRRACAGRAW